MTRCMGETDLLSSSAEYCLRYFCWCCWSGKVSKRWTVFLDSMDRAEEQALLCPRKPADIASSESTPIALFPTIQLHLI